MHLSAINAVEKVSNVSYENLNYDQVEIIYHHMACIQRHNYQKYLLKTPLIV